MGLSQAQLRARVYKATGTVSTDWLNGDTDIDGYLNTSWWEISDSYDFREKESSLGLDTIIGTDSYSLPTAVSPSIFDSLQTVNIEDLNTCKWNELLLISLQDYENSFINEITFRAKPERYFRRGSNIILFPVPDAVYRIRIYYLLTLADIAAGGPPIPQSWHESILFGAIWRAFADLGDENKVRMWKALQADSINTKTPVKVKELTDTKMAGVEVPGRSYP